MGQAESSSSGRGGAVERRAQRKMHYERHRLIFWIAAIIGLCPILYLIILRVQPRYLKNKLFASLSLHRAAQADDSSSQEISQQTLSTTANNISVELDRLQSKLRQHDQEVQHVTIPTTAHNIPAVVTHSPQSPTRQDDKHVQQVTTETFTTSQSTAVITPVGTPALKTSSWTFTYLKRSANGRKCPKTCDSHLDASCGRCIRIGDGMRSSNIFEVSNVFYVYQQGAWFYGPDEQMVIDCGTACEPTWEGWPDNGYRWCDWDTQPRSRVKPSISCHASNTNMDPVLIVRWMSPYSMHHFYTNTVLTTFMTVGHIAKVLGCSTKQVKVYMLAGMVGTSFPDMWNLLFTEIRGADLLSGCYKKVFYGYMFNTVLRLNMRGTVYDPTLSSWMAAFQLNLRAGLVPAYLLKAPQRSILLVQNNNVPGWLNEVEWGTEGVEIERSDLLQLPYKEQLSKVAVARGMLSVNGLGAAQYVFLPPGSMTGYLALLELAQDGKQCVAKLSALDPGQVQAEEVLLTAANHALNMGHTFLLWRWCRPDIFDESWRFTSEHAQVVLKLLLSLNSDAHVAGKVHACYVLNGNPKSAGWPQCDQHVTAPSQHFKKICEGGDCSGLPYNFNDKSSYIEKDDRLQFAPYKATPKYLWKGKVTDTPENADNQQHQQVTDHAAEEPNTPRWSFTHHQVIAHGKTCPRECDPNVDGSCGRCLIVGNGMRNSAFTHLFEVTNVYYVYQQGSWFYGPGAQMVKDCGNACAITWEGWPTNGYQWYEYDNQPRERMTPSISCDANSFITDPVLLVRWLFPNNAYHFYTDTVLATFMTVGVIAKVLGISAKQVKVHCVAGMLPTYFPNIWTSLFTEIIGADVLDGCYKKVFYGHMFNNVPWVDTKGTVYDPVLSSWMAAWRFNVRADLVSAEDLKASPTVMLLVHHGRAPDWFDKVDWRIQDVQIAKIDFAKLPYRMQISRVAVARGLFGIGGSGFAQQVFLPQGSLIGYLAIFEIRGNLCMARMMKGDPTQVQSEDASLCYANTAMNIGNNVLLWRWCRLQIFDEEWAFTSQHAQAVLKLLLSLKSLSDASGKVQACYVLDNNPNTDGWPRCDQHIQAPVPHFTASCNSYGCGGLPYNLKDNSSYIEHDNRIQYTPYTTGPKWLWNGKVTPLPSIDQNSKESQQALATSPVTTTEPQQELATSPETTTGKPSWKFHYLKLSAKGRKCPRHCPSDAQKTCGLCIQIGNWMRETNSQVFEVNNVFYVKSQGSWFYGGDEGMVKACGSVCKPSWDGWPANGYDWYEWDTQPRSRKRPQFSCDESNMITDPVLLVRWMFPNNAYHFYTDTVLATYITVGFISKVLGCSSKQVKVHIIAGLLPTYFPEMWRSLFEEIRGADLLNGCYKKVFYGHMFWNVPAVNTWGTVYDPTLSSWMTAWRLNLRAGLVSPKLLNAPPGPMLHVQHARAPDWYFKIDWSIPGVEIEQVDFMKLPYKQQISKVAASRGLFGVGGSGFAQQVFLRPGSLIGYLAIFETTDGKTCNARMSRSDAGHLQTEDASLCYANTAVNIGNSVLLWRWCRPDIFDEAWGFASQHAQSVLKLLLSLKNDADASGKMHACYVLDNNPNTPGWPRCDQRVTAPAPHFTESCDTYGCGGQPYNLNDYSTYIDRDKRIQYTPYATGPKWLWSGKVSSREKQTGSNTAGKKQPQWKFTAEPVSAHGKQCPRTCENAQGSCGVCHKIGNSMRAGFNTHLFEVSNVFYVYRQGSWFYGPDEKMVIACGEACNPSWEGWPMAGAYWYEFQDQPRKRVKPEIACDASNSITDPLLLARWLFPQNAYHFYLDSVLSTYMTVGYISNVLGISAKQVKVAITAGFLDTFFPDMWSSLFQEILYATELQGCYKKVFYGHMWLNIFWVDLWGTVYDPTLSSWMAAWRLNMRSGLLTPDQLKAPEGTMLHVHHSRAPDWYFSIDWSTPGVAIEKVDFAQLPYRQQINKVATARGLFGIGGSGFAHQVFLRPGSLIGYLAIFELRDDQRNCLARMSKIDPNHLQSEDSSLCYANTAINIGNNVLVWRWCRPEIFNEAWGFRSKQAQAVFRLLLSLTSDADSTGKVRACYVLDNNPNTPGWPRCDQHVTAPKPHFTDSCDTYGCGAQPYNLMDNSSFLASDDRVQTTAYTAGPKWLWSGKLDPDAPKKKKKKRHTTPPATTVTNTNAVTTANVDTSWTFSYLPYLSAGGRDCPRTCDADDYESCGQCIRVGNGMRSGADTHIYEVTNVFYVESQGAWLHGTDEEFVKNCGYACRPTWDNWPASGYQWHDWDTQPRERVRPEIQCDASNTKTDPVLLVRWQFPHNVHHFYTDTVLTTYMTTEYIARVLGIVRKQVKVYVIAGLMGTAFPDMWRMFFGEIVGADKLSGCYRKVFYGQMHNQIPRANLPGVVYDPTLSSWMAAFRFHLRAGLVSTDLLNTPPGRMLLVKHARAPDWFSEVDFSIPGVEIEPIDFAALPYRTQVSRVAASRGLLGVSGSGLAQHVFLPHGSILGFVVMLEDTHGVCQARMSKSDPGYLQEENTALCYVNTALNTGTTTTLMWRWCRPDIYSSSAAFQSEHAQAVLQLLLTLSTASTNKNKVSACFVLDGNPRSVGWPRCDQQLGAPAACSESCKDEGPSVLPYNPADNSSFISRDERVKFFSYEGSNFRKHKKRR